MGTQKSLFHSTNGGDTWTDMDLPVVGSGFYSSLLHPSDPATIYAVQDNTIIHKTTDGGKIWRRLPTVQLEAAITGCFPIRVSRMVLDPTVPDEIYGALEECCIISSLDGGRPRSTKARTW